MASASDTAATASADEIKRQFFLRGKQGINVMWGPPGDIKKHDGFQTLGGFGLTYNPSGEFVAECHAKGVSIFETESGIKRQEIQAPGVKYVSFSYLGTFLVTWEPPTAANKERGNLGVWKVSPKGQNGNEPTITTEAITWFSHKNISTNAWPIRWNPSETVCAHLATNSLHFYNGQTPSGRYIAELRIPKLKSFAMTEIAGLTRIAVFVTESKGAPGFVRIYNYPNVLEHVCQKSFYKADSVDLMWSPNGRSLLAMTHTDEDKSGKSYYGETNLYFMKSDGSFDCNVPLVKEGPIYDVCWNPTSKDFIVVHGFMPAKAILFDTKCTGVFDFGAAPRNTVKYSPHGRFICIAGFGNLQGEMDFWDRNKLKKIGYGVANCAVSFAWSPCSRYCLTATLFPRLRVDNGYKIWTYDGRLIHQEDFQELYEVGWRSTPKEKYPDRPATPRKNRPEDAQDGKPSIPQPAAPVRQAYVPPHLRNKKPEEKVQASKAFEREVDGPKKLVGNSRPSAQKPAVVGAPTQVLSKSALKNKKRAEKKRQMEALELEKKRAAEIAAAAGIIDPTASSSSQQPKQTQPEKPAEPVDPAKRAKTINKKLKQIENLLAKKEAGETLDPEQQAKVDSKDALVKELESLEV